MVHLQEFGPAKVSLLVRVRSPVGFCVCVCFFWGKLIRVFGLILGIVVVVVRIFFPSSRVICNIQNKAREFAVVRSS